MRKYEVVSGDSHLECSPDLWRKWVDGAYQDWVPAVVDLPDGGDGLVFKGSRDPLPITRSLAGGNRAVAEERGYRKRCLPTRCLARVVRISGCTRLTGTASTPKYSSRRSPGTSS